MCGIKKESTSLNVFLIKEMLPPNYEGKDQLTIQTPMHLSAFLKIDRHENTPALICHPEESVSICR